MKEEKGSMKEEKGRMTSRKRKTDSMVRKRAKGDEDCFKFNSSNSFYFVLLCIKREKIPMVKIFKICNKFAKIKIRLQNSVMNYMKNAKDNV